jgi:hypothetical protein
MTLLKTSEDYTDTDLIDWLYEQPDSFVVDLLQRRMSDTLRELVAAAVAGDTTSQATTLLMSDVVREAIQEEIDGDAAYEEQNTSGSEQELIDDDNRERAKAFKGKWYA